MVKYGDIVVLNMIVDNIPIGRCWCKEYIVRCYKMMSRGNHIYFFLTGQ